MAAITHPEWYAALARLTGYAAAEIHGCHYYTQGGPPPLRRYEVAQWFSVLGVNAEAILKEIPKGDRVLYAAGWHRPDGRLSYFYAPTESAQRVRAEAVPPTAARCWHQKATGCYYIATTKPDPATLAVLEKECGRCPVPVAHIIRIDGEERRPFAKWVDGVWVKR